MSIEESKMIFDKLISNCTLQTNGSYISSEGRIIWTSIEGYKTANSSNTKGTFTKKKIVKKTTKKKK